MLNEEKMCIIISSDYFEKLMIRESFKTWEENTCVSFKELPEGKWETHRNRYILITNRTGE